MNSINSPFKKKAHSFTKGHGDLFLIAITKYLMCNKYLIS